jgi:hypothetical protein
MAWSRAARNLYIRPQFIRRSRGHSSCFRWSRREPPRVHDTQCPNTLRDVSERLRPRPVETPQRCLRESSEPPPRTRVFHLSGCGGTSSETSATEFSLASSESPAMLIPGRTAAKGTSGQLCASRPSSMPFGLPRSRPAGHARMVSRGGAHDTSESFEETRADFPA